MQYTNYIGGVSTFILSFYGVHSLVCKNLSASVHVSRIHIIDYQITQNGVLLVGYCSLILYYLNWPVLKAAQKVALDE